MVDSCFWNPLPADPPALAGAKLARTAAFLAKIAATAPFRNRRNRAACR